MNIRRLSASIAITSALVVLGGITAGLILARDQAPRAAPPSPDVISSSQEVPATPAVAFGLASKTGPAATPTPEPTATPEPPAAPPMEGSAKEAAPELEGASQGMVYTWQDGDRTLKAVLQATPMARETEPAAGATEDYGVAKEDYGVTKGEVNGIVGKQSELGSDGQPVFRSESGGELMTLPGGIILALDPEWDQDAVEKFFLAQRHFVGTGVGTGLPGQWFLCGNGAGLSFPGTGQRAGRPGRRDSFKSQLVEGCGVEVMEMALG